MNKRFEEIIGRIIVLEWMGKLGSEEHISLCDELKKMDEDRFRRK